MSNAFSQFQNLIGKTSLEVVTITLDNGNGTSQATTLSGVLITVKGDSIAVGSKAFIQGNEIVRQAPDLTITEVSI